MKRTRKNARVDCIFEGRLHGPRGTVRGTVHSLSTGGLFFAAASLAVTGQAELELDLGGEPLRATCEVVYRRVGEGGGVGLRFVRLDPRAVEHIQRVLAAAN